MIHTEWKKYPDIKDAYAIRVEVFVQEQKVPIEEEIDELDKTVDHLVVYEGESPVATGRLVYIEGKWMAGRIAVLKAHRGKKYGDLVVRLLMRRAFDLGAEEVWIHGQTQAEGFYKKLGFVPVGEGFMEAGIEHIKMVCKEFPKGCCHS